jgi:hypothetical protein
MKIMLSKIPVMLALFGLRLEKTFLDLFFNYLAEVLLLNPDGLLVLDEILL